MNHGSRRISGFGGGLVAIGTAPTAIHRLYFDAERVRDTVDVVEVRDDLDGVMHGLVRPSGVSQGLHIVPGHGRRIDRQLIREPKQRLSGAVNRACGPVVDQSVNEIIRVGEGPPFLFIGDLGTEIVRVGLYSVMALVSDAYDHCEHFALCPAER